MTEYEQKREEIAREFCKRDYGNTWEKLPNLTKECYLGRADKILSLDGIEIRAADQTPPSFLTLGNANKLELVNETRESMLKPDLEGKHWVRVIPKKETEEKI